MSLDVGYGGTAEPHATAGHGVDEQQKLRLGMLMYIANDVILAIFFIGTYIFLRGYNSNQRWYLPSGTSGPSGTTTTIIMGLIVLSGLAFFGARQAIGRGNQSAFRALVVVAFVLAFADLVYQIWFMYHLPFTLDAGGFASSFILLSGYHVYHVLVGIFLGIGVIVRAFQGRYAMPKLAGLDVISVYWYWMALYGILFWLLVLIQPPFLR